MDSFKVRTGAQDMQKVKGRLLTEHLNLKLTAWRGRSIPTVNSDKAISSHSEKKQDPEMRNPRSPLPYTLMGTGRTPFHLKAMPFLRRAIWLNHHLRHRLERCWACTNCFLAPTARNHNVSIQILLPRPDSY